MSREWTPNQKKAIDARNMQILVSAAAGSGKTSVLTERVKNILCDTENPCAVSELLVVTFTRAAASEMRDRIYKAIGNEIESNGGNGNYLYRQMTLLPTADICTIDSFCAKIVRENFHLADVGADFTILDEKDQKELMKYALKEVIDTLYEEQDESFLALTKMFLNERDDVSLEEVVEKLYEYSRSYPSPSGWLDGICEYFSPENSPANTSWVDVVCKYLHLFADFYVHRLNRCASLLEESGNFDPNYIARFIKSAEVLEELRSFAEAKQWDSVVGVIRRGLVVWPTSRNGKVDKELQALTDKVFKEYAENVKNIEAHTLPTLSEHKDDCETLYPIVKKLCEAVKRLTAHLEESKKEKNAYTFDDILHKAIELLVKIENGKEVKTPLAEELTLKYKEILIDEYQDTNKAQNKIFEIISRDKTNLYTVGDVKQSIYGFRLASPELFMNLKDSLSDYDGNVHPSQITLENNFRSREGVTKAVNYVFERIMTRDVGEIDYNEREFLNYSAGFSPKSTPDTEVICIKTDKDDAPAPTEPETVAQYIKSVVESGVTVRDSKGERRVRWGDFCILLRSAKNKVGQYCDELKKLSVPVSVSIDSDAAEYKEIQFLISLIKVINNPLIDIPLIAVLLSPIYGFTPDELAQIRMIDRKADFYVCLVRYAEKSQKAKAFLDKIQLYRNISVAYPINEFVRFVLDDIAVSDIFYAAGEGDRRRANINGFRKLSQDFVDSGRSGLNDFVRYLDIAEEKGAISGFDSDFNDDNSVKIMSVHKSKGLEFPYVIVANCSKAINRQDSTKQLTLSKDTGIGIRIRDDGLFTRYHTLSSVATEKSILFSILSEELRVLYVAMTRAKEHLTFFVDVSDVSLRNRVRINHELACDNGGKLHPYSVFRAKSISEWLLSCLSGHRDGAIIRDLCGIPQQSFTENSGFSFDCSLIESRDDIFSAVDFVPENTAPVNDGLLAEITENINYEYPFDFSEILAKRTASSTETTRIKREYFGTRKPQFLSDTFSGADRGTAIHKFLELCDFSQAAESIEKEKNRLKDSSQMSAKELEALDTSAVKSFLESSVGKRLLKAQQVYKEYEFSVLKNAGEIYNDIPENAKNEQIVVQGKLDCAFVESDGAVLIDYKTDNITDENVFVSVYKNQLKIYADALLECTGIPVKEIYIYSFKLKKFIKL